MADTTPLLEPDSTATAVASASDANGSGSDLAELGVGGRIQTIQELLQVSSDDALDWLHANGIKKLGEFELPEEVATKLLKESGFLVTGCDLLDNFDWKTFWKLHLDKRSGKMGITGWGRKRTVEAYVVNVKDALEPGAKGLLQNVVKKYQVDEDPAIFKVPAVEATVLYKWQKWAYTFLMVEFFVYLFWLFGFTGFVWLFQDEDLTLSLAGVLSTPRGIATVTLLLVSTLAMVPFVLIEVASILHYGVEWFSLWNTLDSFAYAFQVVITVLYLVRNVDDDELSVVLAVQCLLLWGKVQYFSRVLQSSSTSMVDTLQIVVGDVKYFLLFTALTLYAFAASFNILYRRDQETEAFKTFSHTIASMFVFATGGIDLDAIWGSTLEYQWFASLLAIVFVMVTAVILLNLLIAVMSEAYNRVLETESERLRANQATMIDELELIIPSCVFPYKSWCPDYVHFIKFQDPPSECTLELVMERLDTLEALLAKLADK